MFSGDTFQNQDPDQIFILKRQTRGANTALTCTEGKGTKVLRLFAKELAENGIGMISESYRLVGCC
jgi:hypothetical protein